VQHERRVGAVLELPRLHLELEVPAGLLGARALVI
jgi:hypothetical protein